MPRETSKCREWEKERRNRLNEAFTTLCKLLPTYDPSTNTSKIDILRHASTYIEELQTKIKSLVSENNDDESKKVKRDEYKKLQERIKKLVSKNEHLCGLLRAAKISIPSDCVFVKKFKPPLVWSNKIQPEQAKILQKKELQKENNASVKKRKFNSKTKNKLTNQNSTPKHRKAILNRSDPKKKRPAKKKKGKTATPPKCVLVLTQPSVTQPCYVITNAPSNNILAGGSTVITNSALITNPLVSSKATKTVTSIPSLGPGTLILANGTIMPVLPQQTVLPLAPQIITRPPIIVVPRAPTSTTTVVNTTTKTTSCPPTKTLAKIKPKYCFTKTTQVNKVPIPALTSRYSNSEVMIKKNDSKQAKTATATKPLDKKVAAKQAEKKTAPVNVDNVEKRKVPNDEPATEPDASKKARVEDDKSVKEAEKAAEVTPDAAPQLLATVEPSKNADKSEKKADEVKTTESNKKADEIDLINHSELSNDIFASLQVPAGCQNPDSTSPTAAFLLAFPLVSSLTGVKVTEVAEEDNAESQRGTPTLLQIGTMNSTKPTHSDSLTPSLLNLDNLSFFSSKDISGFYNSFEATSTAPVVSTTSISSTSTSSSTTTITTASSSVLYPSTTTSRLEMKSTSKEVAKKVEYRQQQQSKNELVPCYENQFTGSSSQMNYHSKQVVKNEIKPQQQRQQNYTSQKFCNNFNAPVKSYADPLYTNSNTYSYNNSDNNFNQNCYKDIAKTTADNRSYYSLNYENYTDYRKNDNTYSSTNYHANSNKFASNSVQKTKNVQSRPPINWMTTPDNRTDYALPQFNTTKENEFSHNNIYPSNTFANTQTTYFGTNSMYNTNDTTKEARNSLEIPLVPPVNPPPSYPRNEIEENQFSWSPTKMPQFLDPPSFVSSTLPTLVGDLALGNPITFPDKCQKKDATKRMKNYESGNFLSVSQLVDHVKEVPARTATRRNSGNRSSVKKPPQKTNQRKEGAQKPETGGKQIKQMSYPSGGDLFCETKNRNVKNSYSAEALIGHQMQPKQSYNASNSKPMSVSSFLHDNIIPYFPTVDLPQDNSYMQQNQNYQPSSFGHNFSTNFQNNTYIPATTISWDVGAHDYDNLNLFPQIKDKTCTKTQSRNVREQQCAVPKKSKRKHANESNLPGFVDFPFLSMPGSINSPILPDDFHTHTGFLQPPTPQLYSCKNPFTKPNDLLPLPPPVPVSKSSIQHPEISPSINSAGTSLTNFNLCTIFPEMNNKSVLADSYPVKEHPRCYSSAAQVTFNDKPTFSFSYINSSSSQNYNNQ